MRSTATRLRVGVLALSLVCATEVFAGQGLSPFAITPHCAPRAAQAGGVQHLPDVCEPGGPPLAQRPLQVLLGLQGPTAPRLAGHGLLRKAP